MLTELFGKKTELVEKLRISQDLALQERSAALAAVDEAHFGVVEGKKDAQTTLADAEARLQRADRALDAAQSALRGALTRFKADLEHEAAATAAAKRKAEKAFLKAKWKASETLGEKYTKQAEALGKAAKQLVADCEALAELGKQFFETAPGERDEYYSHSHFSPAQILLACKRELGRFNPVFHRFVFGQDDKVPTLEALAKRAVAEVMYHQDDEIIGKPPTTEKPQVEAAANG